MTGLLAGTVATAVTASPALGVVAGLGAKAALAKLVTDRTTAMLKRELGQLNADEEAARKVEALSQRLQHSLRESLAIGQGGLLAMLEQEKAASEQDFEQMTRFLQHRFDEVVAGQSRIENALSQSAGTKATPDAPRDESSSGDRERRERELAAVERCSDAMFTFADRLHVLGTFVTLTSDPEQADGESYATHIHRLKDVRFDVIREAGTAFRRAIDHARLYLPAHAIVALDSLAELRSSMESGWVRFAVGVQAGDGALASGGQMAVLEAEQQIEQLRKAAQAELRRAIG